MLKELNRPGVRTAAAAVVWLLVVAMALRIVTGADVFFSAGASGADFKDKPAVTLSADKDTRPGGGLIGLSSGNTLEQSLDGCVDSYKNIWQTIGTAPFNSTADALAVIDRYDAVIDAAAQKYGVDKAVIQAILFQEIRFINVLDEVDSCVEATYLLLHEREAQDTAVSSHAVSAADTAFVGFSFTDSSTGLGQIYARSAIKALNWYLGARLYDEDDWKDREKIWLRLKYDDAFNIGMVGLICRYNDYILENDAHIKSPSAWDIFRIYNGSGPWADKYGDAVYSYYLVFLRCDHPAAARAVPI